MNTSSWKPIGGLLLLLFTSNSATAQVGVIDNASRPLPTLTSVSASGESTFPRFSADGRFVAFMSAANNLVTNVPTVGVLDIFIRDLRAGSTALASINRSGSSGGNGHSLLAGLSDDGRIVAFSSEASDLVETDSNGVSDVLVRDLSTGKTILVSVNLAGTKSGNGASSNPVISRDGRFVAFESDASDLSPNDTNKVTDVFVRNLQNGTTTLVSVVPSGAPAGIGSSTAPVLTPDGRFVAFIRRPTEGRSRTSNTVAAFALPSDDVYVRDLATERTTWASAAAASFRPTLTTSTNVAVSSYNPVLSADGRFVVFKSVTRADDRALILRYDMQSGTTSLVSADAFGNIAGIEDNSGPVMSSDGRFIAFESKTNSPTRRIILRWDSSTATMAIASVNGDGKVPRAGNSESPSMSADGRWLAFLSDATDLVANAAVPGSFQPYVRDLASQSTRLVSANRNGEVTDANDVRSVAISADGRFLAFESLATDLIANDYNRATDVFVRDTANDALGLISERHAALPSASAEGPASLSLNSIDAEGRYLLFTSDAANLAANDSNGLADLFVRDLLTRSNVLVTASADGTTKANGVSHDSVLSRNGRFVAFASTADNLVPNDTNRLDDVFLRDLATGKTILVSRTSNGQSSGNGASTTPSISAEGRYVVFKSAATNLIAGLVDSNGARNDVFVFDAIAGTNRLVSLAFADSTQPNDLTLPTIDENQTSGNESFDPQISADGRFVLYLSRLEVQQRWLLRDLVTWTTYGLPGSPVFFSGVGQGQFSADGRFLVCFFGQTNSFFYDLTRQVPETLHGAVSLPTMSANGRWVAFESAESVLAGKRQITLLDRETGVKTIITPNFSRTGPANGDSITPMMSDDGRFVVFASKASDLVRGDDNGFTDVFLYDRLRDQTSLVSRSRTGSGPGNRLSTKPVISANARTMAFQSFAGDLVDGNFNPTSDIFFLQLASKDSDGDGLDDDWEMTYFANLSRDGAGDFDGDGMRDLEEFKAGTNPTNNVSIFRTSVLRSVAGQPTTISWNAVAGRTYVVQYKDSLGQRNWSSLEGYVTASDATASKADPTSPGRSERFYRVLQID